MATVNWVHTYDPQIHIGSTVYRLPRPVRQISDDYTNKINKIEIPQQNGTIIGNVSRSGATVTFAGIISKNTRSGVLHEKQMLHDVLMNTGGQPFTFYRFYDAARENYRWYENCVCENLSFVEVPGEVFSMAYSLTLFAPDGLEHELVTTRNENPSGDQNGNLSNRAVGGYGGSEVVYYGDDSSEVYVGSETAPDDTARLYGPLLIKMRYSSSSSDFAVVDGDGNIIFKIDGSGNVYVKGNIISVDSITF